MDFIRSPNSNGVAGSLSLGDLNGDGASDVVLGARTVLLGTPGERPAQRAIDALNGSNGFRFSTGITSARLQGLDVNGDTFDDLVFDFRNYLPGRPIDVIDPGAPPTPGVNTPTGFRVQVYSRNALELFWDRATPAGLRYEVRRGDTLLGTSKGTSLFLESIDARADATYSLVAIDRDGKRSSPVTVEVEGGQGPVVGTLSPPADLRVTVYSSSALELFWDRASTPALRYEINRDGEAIGMTDGTSLFLSKVEARRAATYSVVAIDRQGRRSAAGTVAVDG